MTDRRSRRVGRHDDGGRGQSNLVAVTVALLALSALAGVVLVVTDDAFAAAERDPDAGRIAHGVANRLVAADGPLADRTNVVNASAVTAFDATDLPRGATGGAGNPPGDRATGGGGTAERIGGNDRGEGAGTSRDVRVRLDGETIAATGPITDGTTVRRLVLVERRQTATVTPRLGAASRRSVVLPRRTPRVTVTIRPTAPTVETVRAGERVVLHDPDGIAGTHEIGVSRHETARLRFVADGRLERGDVALAYVAAETTKATLSVTAEEKG
ncbi:hypothetical protein BRD17_04075 [Halobacteriales archaeon SW_7_68_16]|nr:MAG: hypothetical protein BRD17_04075 [Halobacteriales archaeon SW_7_68_16]